MAFVLKGYPRLSETFIAQEMLALEQLGLDIEIVSLRHPTDRATHPVHGQIRAPVRYLPEYLRDEPRRVFDAWRRVRLLPAYRAARRVWLADLVRDPTPNRIRRFGQAGPGLELAPIFATACAFSAHAGVGRAVPRRCAGWVESVGPCQGYLDVPAWEKRDKLDRRDGRSPALILGALPGRVAARQSRCPITGSISSASRRRAPGRWRAGRQRSGATGHCAVGRSGGREGL